MSRTRTTARFWAALTGIGVASTLGAGHMAAFAVDAPPANPAPADPSDVALEAGKYLVVLAEDAAASYNGGLPGLPATKPADGERLDTEDRDVKKYTAHLEKRQEQVAKSVGAKPEEKLSVVLNGFIAELSAEQAAQLAAKKDVAALVEPQMLQLDTVESPEMLGLTGADGAWRKYGTPRRAGEGVVVGIIDSGITPENPSFSGRKLRKDDSAGRVNQPVMDSEGNVFMKKSDGNDFKGLCQTGDEFKLDDCNTKLIGARYFDKYLKLFNGDDPVEEGEFFSPRDADGHGTHTAGTAVGNYGVPMSVDGVNFGRGSGMAPAAKLAAYKVCWNVKGGGGGCNSFDSVMAIEQAVEDGVDVINFSISGTRDNVFDPVERAFLSAAAAGVFVAASAGNSGPAPETVAHNSPWLTTVAASEFYARLGTVITGDGQRYAGASVINDTVPPTAAILAKNAGLADVKPEDAALCKENTLDPEKVSGKLVVCDRGEIARVAKSAEAERAGAVAMVHRNMSPDSTNAEVHSVPTVHVDEIKGAAIGEYVENAENPTISLVPGNESDEADPPMPQVAGFSSRGPALAADSNLLKPDISAPGAGVLAAVSPQGRRDFNFLSGTSMSSPHIAGLAALIYGKHPNWAPMTIKSAMMTTARDHFNADGTIDNDHFAAGSGFVDPKKFYEPGLVYKSGVADWLGYLKNQGADLPEITEIRTVDLNLPSFAVSKLAGVETVTRSVTSMEAGTFKANVDMPGFDVKVEPSTLTFAKAGETKDFTVTFTRTDAPLNEYKHGWLTWTGGTHDVRSPITLRAVAVKAPEEVVGEGTSGEETFSVQPGSTGELAMSIKGLVAGEVNADSIAQGGLNLTRPDDANKHFTFEVPEGTAHARFDLVAGANSSDLDLIVRNTTTGKFLPFLRAGMTGAASERIDLPSPEAGTYQVIVNAYGIDGDTGEFTLRTFIVPNEDAGNAAVSPNPVDGKQGQASDVTLSWNDLADAPHLGLVTYEGSQVRTIVAID